MLICSLTCFGIIYYNFYADLFITMPMNAKKKAQGFGIHTYVLGNEQVGSD